MKKNNKHVFALGQIIPTVCAVMMASTLQATEAVIDVKPRLAPLSESAFDGQQKSIVSAMGIPGKLPNIFAVTIRNPELMVAWNHLGLYMLRGSSLPPRDKELLILRTGWLAKSEYEFSHHRIIGKKIGLTDEDIVRVTKGPNAQGWQTSERYLLQAVDELFHDRTLSDSTWSKLSKQYSEKQLLDLIVAVGQYNSVSTLLNALHVPLEEGVVGWSDLMSEMSEP